jgi:hypothetical protein
MSITFIELSFDRSMSFYFEHGSTFPCHYDHVTKSPEQCNIHVFMNNDVLSIVPKLDLIQSTHLLNIQLKQSSVRFVKVLENPRVFVFAFLHLTIFAVKIDCL